jgi:hypothetical protein
MKLLCYLLLFNTLIFADCIDCIKPENPMKKVSEQVLDQLTENIDDSKILNCLALDKYGCLYKKGEVKNDRLVIYHRGHWGEFGGNVPLSLRTTSINQAINFYELGKSADELDSVMLISSSSIVGYTIQEIESAISNAGLDKNSKVTLVAHSGGYFGLIKTLNYLKQAPYEFEIEKIVMLDNFYFEAAKTELFKEYLDQGIKCSGFYTQHNQARYIERFRSEITPETCPIEQRTGHNTSVNSCLVNYVLASSCP